MKQGPSIFRLDAVAFLWKRIESNCINLDQTHAIIRLLRIILSYNKNKCMIVTETNLPFLENFSYFGRSDEAAEVQQTLDVFWKKEMIAMN